LGADLEKKGRKGRSDTDEDIIAQYWQRIILDRRGKHLAMGGLCNKAGGIQVKGGHKKGGHLI